MTNMTKIDLFKTHKADYVAAKKPIIIDVAKASYISITGIGAPGDNAFTGAIEALYAMAYTVKMTRKKNNKGDYVICKLEARYWSDSQQCLSEVDKSQWHWQLMIRTPASVEISDLELASAALVSKGKTIRVNDVELIEHKFGECIQMLHIGSYEEESRTIDQMLAFAKQEGLTVGNEHCEIYISDPRRVPAERLKTILRAPLTT
jgi:hypothetical protein